MPGKRSILLSGATGFLGGRLLVDLLAHGRNVVVLARDKKGKTAEQRIRDQIEFWSGSLYKALPSPEVISCDLRDPGAGLGPLDIRFLGEKVGPVIHAAASLAFRPNNQGEPWRTNVGGTENLLSVCRRAGLSDWHQVSTAFVCGRTETPVFPEDVGGPDSGLSRNAYEESKAQAEKVVRGCSSIRSTIYRPSIIVGEARTGKTNGYSGLYRFLEIGLRLGLAQGKKGKNGPARIPIRLPLQGNESWNLVPVDWVAQAIRLIMDRQDLSGGIFHLVSPRPVTASQLVSAGSRVLGVVGVELASPGSAAKPSPLEISFLDACREYWPYLSSSQNFDASATLAALPGLPCPAFDEPALNSLFQYARDHKWSDIFAGNDDSDKNALVSWPLHGTIGSPVCRLVEKVLPELVAKTDIGRHIDRDYSFQLNIHGKTGGRWKVRLGQQKPVSIHKSASETSEPENQLAFGLEDSTFLSLVAGKLTPQMAFFQGKVKITGDIERGMLLGHLFGRLIREVPGCQTMHDGPILDASA